MTDAYDLLRERLSHVPVPVWRNVSVYPQNKLEEFEGFILGRWADESICVGLIAPHVQAIIDDNKMDKKMPRVCYAEGCNKQLKFREMLQANDHLRREELEVLWLDERIQLYCCDCYNARITLPIRPRRNDPTMFQVIYDGNPIDCEIESLNIEWVLGQRPIITLRLYPMSNTFLGICNAPTGHYETSVSLKGLHPMGGFEIHNLYVTDITNILNARRRYIEVRLEGR